MFFQTTKDPYCFFTLATLFELLPYSLQELEPGNKGDDPAKPPRPSQ